MQEQIFVPLELAGLKESILNDSEIASHFALNDELRPSIETAMHAVLRHVLSSTCTRSTPLPGQYVWMDPSCSKSDWPACTGNRFRTQRPPAYRWPEKLKRQLPVRRRRTFSSLEITDWSSADSIAIPPKHFCVK
jgi:hypothetical protein